jgi:hypothetical protein
MPTIIKDEGRVLEPQADTTNPNVKTVASFPKKDSRRIGVSTNYAVFGNEEEAAGGRREAPAADDLASNWRDIRRRDRG